VAPLAQPVDIEVPFAKSGVAADASSRLEVITHPEFIADFRLLTLIPGTEGFIEVGELQFHFAVGGMDNVGATGFTKLETVVTCPQMRTASVGRLKGKI